MAGLYLEEGDTGHPEQIPLLGLRQVDNESLVCGIWCVPGSHAALAVSITNEDPEWNVPRRWCTASSSKAFGRPSLRRRCSRRVPELEQSHEVGQLREPKIRGDPVGVLRRRPME
jgi:hypothetical protein